ncbi:MAG: methyltransferase domain-containing protein [Gammaproteobacteria bacterium]|nr:methyltransferase domain-containing protein [Gammaproteobacteria bacterium]
MQELDALQIKWNQRHADPTHQPRAAEVLYQNLHLLPVQGRALDLACGLGGNALLMAKSGLQVTAWDLSQVAINRLKGYAEAQGFKHLQAEVRDLGRESLPVESFDIIVVSYFLERALVAPLITALKPGGLLFYQTFTRISVDGQGPSNPDFRLADNELLRLFEPLAVRYYREENRLGSLTRGVRDVAMLVAEKPRVNEPRE